MKKLTNDKAEKIRKHLINEFLLDEEAGFFNKDGVDEGDKNVLEDARALQDLILRKADTEDYLFNQLSVYNFFQKGESIFLNGKWIQNSK
ncbi:MAG: hypothetical protein ACTSXT_13590 [Candidatus Helarchaeota archaeon]